MHAAGCRAESDATNKKGGGHNREPCALKLPDIGTITSARHFFVRLKPKLFPNRAGLSRFLGRFEMLVRMVRGGALDDMQ
jgi:hypothetical protein